MLPLAYWLRACCGEPNPSACVCCRDPLPVCAAGTLCLCVLQGRYPGSPSVAASPPAPPGSRPGSNIQLGAGMRESYASLLSLRAPGPSMGLQSALQQLEPDAPHRASLRLSQQGSPEGHATSGSYSWEVLPPPADVLAQEAQQQVQQAQQAQHLVQQWQQQQQAQQQLPVDALEARPTAAPAPAPADPPRALLTHAPASPPRAPLSAPAGPEAPALPPPTTGALQAARTAAARARVAVAAALAEGAPPATADAPREGPAVAQAPDASSAVRARPLTGLASIRRLTAQLGLDSDEE
jgi:hypothetical protein